MRLLVIGGSDAGISAGLRARELDPTADVTLLVADRCPNFSAVQVTRPDGDDQVPVEPAARQLRCVVCGESYAAATS
ncbi:hypothetical protein GCM10009827_058850 [Dactylosporangium maewongense]|uniref:Pyridine nucleotide-disulfide oxidoreductase n=1 Tax=Dactylosporangium maewongense TaxID=634393 RepID=A0ABN2B5X4_9ACTN